ncbi:MAG TPA: alpha/beta hydrolase [Dehalococcoidia bacterium]|nr:alpha/beta hydrolase [Dehalococcoidia bacterium]
MPEATVDGLKLVYEELGSGIPIVWLQGARSGRDLMRPIAGALAAHNRCIIYDRRNCGDSDVLIAGAQSEQEIWADELAGLLDKLGTGPAYLGGWSAGCRVALLTAIRHPRVVRGLLLGWVTGGNAAAQQLSRQYYGQFIEAAQQGGMQAVVETPFFAERCAANPGNRARLLGMDAGEFIATMQRWERFFSEGGDLPVIGATEEELASIKVPTAIVAGDDDVHPTSAAQNLHRILPNSQYMEPPIPKAEFDAFPSFAERDRVRAERSAPFFSRFLEAVEAGTVRG